MGAERSFHGRHSCVNVFTSESTSGGHFTQASRGGVVHRNLKYPVWGHSAPAGLTERTFSVSLSSSWVFGNEPRV